jgi:hypothetical protein
LETAECGKGVWKPGDAGICREEKSETMGETECIGWTGWLGPSSKERFLDGRSTGDDVSRSL